MSDGRAGEFRALAADCIRLATNAADPGTRATLTTMAQKWFELANERSRFESVIDDFNERQMKRDAPPQSSSAT